MSKELATAKKINVSFFLSEAELEATINAISSKEHTFSPETYSCLISTLNQAIERLHIDEVGKPSLGNCKYCNAEILWINRVPFQVILPQRANPVRSNIHIERHHCKEMIKVYKSGSPR